MLNITKIITEQVGGWWLTYLQYEDGSTEHIGTEDNYMDTELTVRGMAFTLGVDVVDCFVGDTL